MTNMTALAACEAYTGGGGTGGGGCVEGGGGVSVSLAAEWVLEQRGEGRAEVVAPWDPHGLLLKGRHLVREGHEAQLLEVLDRFVGLVLVRVLALQGQERVDVLVVGRQQLGAAGDHGLGLVVGLLRKRLPALDLVLPSPPPRRRRRRRWAGPTRGTARGCWCATGS